MIHCGVTIVVYRCCLISSKWMCGGECVIHTGMLAVAHCGVRRMIGCVSRRRGVRWTRRGRWQLVLHTIVFGTHGNRLNIHAVAQAL
jgi:hypothetical protein